MRLVPRWIRLALVPASCVAFAGARAQFPVGARDLTPAAVAESLAVLKELDRTVRRDSRDAAAWHRRGMIAWALFERERYAPPVRGLDWTLLTRLADTSLRRAAWLEPDNPAYYLAAGRFLLAAAVPYRRYGPYGVFTETLDRARKGTDRDAHAEAAIDAGRLHWTRRECGGGGDPAVLGAEASFFEAFNAAPHHPRAFRHLAMFLAERQRWLELTALGRARTEASPGNAWAWMALGLGAQRIGDGRAAAAAFDSALARLDVDERDRLLRFDRVLTREARESYLRLGPAERARTEQLYWLYADPLWSIRGDEPRTEFLARLAYAEFRWSSEETHIGGADTFVGDRFVRTGLADPNVTGCRWTFHAHAISGQPTAFDGPPARWGNPGRMRIDSMPAQLARFRAPHDSVDVFIATVPPVDAIARRAEVDVPVSTRFWILAGGLDGVVRESVQPSQNVPHVFTNRLAPGSYVYRAEAGNPVTLVAGRTSAAFVAGDDPRTGFRARGFGMSDVLIATEIAARTGNARRWHDLDVQPMVGSVPFDGTFALLWEMYDFQPDSGAMRYSVSITIRRDDSDRSAAGRIAARIVSGFASVAGENRRDGEVEFVYDRDVPHAPALVDHVTLSVGETPPGVYLVSLRVTDRVSGQMLGRSQRLTIR